MNQSHPSHQGARVCLCADDFGLNEGINDAVLRLISLGRVHATSALVGAPAWTSGAQRLRSLGAAGVDAGLHLDFTECSLTMAPRGLSQLILQSCTHRQDRHAIRQEIRAQLDAFEQAMGAAPSFVDGHQHVHQFSVIREELLEELDERYSGPSPWVRNTHWRAIPGASTGLLGWLKAVTISALGGADMTDAARHHGYLQNTALLGIYDFRASEARYLQLLQAWLASAQDGDLLMCHPGHEPASHAGMAQARKTEYQVLVGQRFGQLIQELGLKLGPMSGILANIAAAPRAAVGAP